MIWRALGVITLLAIITTFGSCSTERRDWRSAQAADTIESYGRFLAEHPEGELAADARARIQQLAEDRDWKRATQADTAAAYERFVHQYPNGRWAQEARIRAESFVLADDGPTRLPSQSNGTSGPAPRNGFSVQLGAFNTEEQARAEWQRLVARFPRELRGLSPTVAAGFTSVGRLHRLQANVSNEREARALCAALAREREACVVVFPMN